MASELIKLTIASAAWANSTAYVVGQYVSRSSVDYRCKLAHTSVTADNAPGTGTSWTTYWDISPSTKSLKLARQNGKYLFESYEVAEPPRDLHEPFFTQTDWSGGMGQGTFKDPTRFSDGSNIDVSMPGRIILGPYFNVATEHDESAAGPVTAWAYHSSTLWIIRASDVLKYATATGHFDTTGDTSSTGQIGACSFGGYLFVACGSTDEYFYSTDGTAWTSSTCTDHHAGGFLVAPSAAGTTEILWKFTANQIASHTTGLNGTEWSTPAYIGESGTSITNLMLHQNRLLVGKTDGLYHYDSDGKVYPLLPELRYNQSTNNFKYVASLKGNTYFSLGTRIGELTANNVFRLMGPYDGLEEMTLKGTCVGLAADNNYLYATMYDGTNWITYKGWQVETESGSRWAWCNWYTRSVLVDTIFCSQVGTENKRLWMCGTGGQVVYLILSDNPKADSGYLYNSSDGYLDTGWIDLGHRDWYKILDSALAEVRDGNSAGRFVQLSYYADEGSVTAIDTTYKADTAGTKMYCDTAPVPAKKVKFRIALITNTSSYSPIVKYFAAYGSVRPTRVRIFDFTVLAEAGPTATGLNIRDFLVDCRDSTSLVTFYDRFGASHYVRVLPGYPIESEIANEDGKEPAVVCKVKLEKVDWS